MCSCFLSRRPWLRLVTRPLSRLRRHLKHAGNVGCNTILLPPPRCRLCQMPCRKPLPLLHPAPHRMSRLLPRPRRLPAGLTCPPIRASGPRESSIATQPFSPKPWRFCGRWFPRTIRTRQTCNSSWVWVPAGGPRKTGLRTSNGSGAPGRGHRGVPVHPDPATGAWCACVLELALAFYLKQDDSVGPRAISSGPWWAARPRSWPPTSNGS